MATLLSSVSANGAGAGASHTGPCTVFVTGTFGPARVAIQVSSEDSNYATALLEDMSDIAELQKPGQVNINAYGTYYVRAVVYDSGGSGVTSISASTTQ